MSFDPEDVHIQTKPHDLMSLDEPPRVYKRPSSAKNKQIKSSSGRSDIISPEDVHIQPLAIDDDDDDVQITTRQLNDLNDIYTKKDMPNKLHSNIARLFD